MTTTMTTKTTVERCQQLYHEYHFCNMTTSDDTTTSNTDDDTDNDSH